MAKQGNYLRIQDVNSGAGGWIEEAALAPAPAQKRAVEATPASPAPVASPSAAPSHTAPKPPVSSSSPTSRTTAAAPKETRKRAERNSGGIFSGNGPLKGLFGSR